MDFAEHIKNDIEEVNMLKTGTQKSASDVELISDTMSVSAVLDSYGYGRVYVKVLPTNNNEILINATLNKINEDENGRQFETYLFFENGYYVVYVGFAGNRDDDATIAGGGTVTLSAILTVVATDNFTMEVM